MPAKPDFADRPHAIDRAAWVAVLIELIEEPYADERAELFEHEREEAQPGIVADIFFADLDFRKVHDSPRARAYAMLLMAYVVELAVVLQGGG